MDIQTEKAEEKKNAKTRVRVAIRVRPMIPKEIANNENSCVEFNGNREIILAKERNYKFDHVFPANTEQGRVYETCVKELVLGCFEGYNAAILAYGQTGSGKTFTMGTAVSTIQSRQSQGIIPRVVRQIFDQVREREKQAEFIVKASFLEIYNEQIIDLLINEGSSKNVKNKQQLITIREEKDGSVSILNVTQEEVSTADQLIELLERGGYHRTTASTLMNDASSRSHAIFTIFIEQHKIDDLYQKDDAAKKTKNNNVNEGVDEGFMTAKFFFVDLAGSQRAKKTGATGATLKEGININMGLLELGNVISALSTIQKKQDQFITYRNSKLTRMLQECLGGNSNTYMIACVSPAESNFEQSLNTLKYASKAMNIKNKPIKNVDPHTAQISQLKQKIYELQVENRKLKGMLNQKGIDVSEVLHNSQDIMYEEVKKMKKLYLSLEKKYEEAAAELKEERKLKNELQIKQFSMKRDRDLACLQLETIKQKYPHEFQQKKRDKNIGEDGLSQDEEGTVIDIGEKMSILNELSSKVESLTNQLRDKEKLAFQLQKAYQQLEEDNKKDQRLLIAKNNSLHILKRQNQKLKKSVSTLKKQIASLENKKNPADESMLDESQLSVSYLNRTENEQYNSEDEELQDSFVNEDLPPQLLEHQKKLDKVASEREQQMSHMERQILERQKYLESMSANQIKLEYQLIEEMKEEWHHKISEIQREKASLVAKMKDQTVGVNEKNKFTNKIDNLETQLKHFRKKAKEQKNMEKLVTNQSSKIKDLANQIKKFKVQKVEIGRKMKEDKDAFQKFKMKKVKELIQARKDSIKKENQIKKMKLQGTRREKNFKKKQEQLNRAKRINEALKNLVKPSNTATKTRKASDAKQSQHDQSFDSSQNSKPFFGAQQIVTEKYCQDHILRCLRKILTEIDQEKVLAKYQNKIKQLHEEIKFLLSEASTQKLKLERILIKKENFTSEQEELTEQQEEARRQLELNVNDLQERINNAQENLQFCEKKYDEIMAENTLKRQVEGEEAFFDLDTEVLYQKIYSDNIENLKVFVRALFSILKNILLDNYQLQEVKGNLQLDINSLQEVNGELKEKMHSMQVDHQRALQQLRQDMVGRYYATLEENSGSAIQNNQGPIQNPSNYGGGGTGKRFEERQKKNYEKKIIDLTKTNRQISHEAQMWRRKCSVVQEKYQNMRSLLSKDKGIGRQKEEGEDPVSNKRRINTSMLDEINEMSNQLESYKLKKVMSSNEEHGEHRTSLRGSSYPGEEKDPSSQFQQGLEYTTNKWECINKFDAHNSSVLSIATHANMLISSSTKSLKIWDLEETKIIADLSGPYLPGLVKYVLVDPERNVLLTACQKSVTIWDLVAINVVSVLKGHKQEVRTMHIMEDILFTGGKGLANSGSLLAWDLRNINPNKPQDQKERNQDIFTFASKGNTLYYGTRNHHVRRMDVTKMEILAPFEPPHMDTVTGLATVGNRLVSGSKDKNLRLWDLEHSVGNIKNTAHAFNDHITTMASDESLPIFYVGSKDGQIKVGSTENDRIEFVGGILGHTQAVNSICPLAAEEQMGYSSMMLASASADKSVRIWKPTSETAERLEKQFLS